MKTAISIPDSLFKQADRLARRQRKSRSKLYSDALADYVARCEDDSITEAINRVIDEVGDEVDPFLAEASRRVAERSEWSRKATSIGLISANRSDPSPDIGVRLSWFSATTSTIVGFGRFSVYC